MKTNLKENKGITLIALIITIILLLILAIVTISAVNEGNLFAHANNAATKYQEEAELENTKITEWISKMEQYETGTQNPQEGGGSQQSENSIYDVAYKIENEIYVFKNTESRVYHFLFNGNKFKDGYYSNITIGTKENYSSRIATEFPGILDSEIKNEVIIDGLNQLYLIRKTGSDEFLCISKDNDGNYIVLQYERDDSYNISDLPYSECDEDK